MNESKVADHMYEVVWPLGKSITSLLKLAPPLPDLNGKTVCLLWNGVFRGDEMYPIISAELKREFPQIRIVDWKTMGNTHGNDEREYVANLPNLLRQEGCDAVISGVGA